MFFFRGRRAPWLERGALQLTLTVLSVCCTGFHTYILFSTLRHQFDFVALGKAVQPHMFGSGVNEYLVGQRCKCV